MRKCLVCEVPLTGRAFKCDQCKSTCPHCNEQMKLSGGRYVCAERMRELAKEWRRKNPGKQRIASIASRYKIPKERAADLAARTECDVCGRSNQALCVDHDHATGKVRGVLCHSCNIALGHVGDNPDTLKAMINYLENN